MEKEIKGIVRPPREMPAELMGQRSQRAIAKSHEDKTPLLITLFAWFCFLRAAIFIIFGLIMGLSAPDSQVAAYIALHFDGWPRAMAPEFVFYIIAIISGMIGWRWMRRDWRARWVAMFFSGATVARILVDMLASKLAGDVTPMDPGVAQALTISVVVNIFVCLYLAFYPGMDQAFSETPWK